MSALPRSTDRILVTQAGSLPRSPELRAMIFDRAEGKPYDRAALAKALRDEVAEVVRKQIELGIDFVNDGELGKTNFNNYVRERMTGFITRPFDPAKDPQPLSISARDMKTFPEYFESTQAGFAWRGYTRPQVLCVEPLRYTGQADLQADLDNFRTAVDAAKPVAAYLNANTPGTIEHWLRNDYYKTEEEFVYAIAECMRVEYKAIVDAGFQLQIDDPDLPDGWQMFPEMSVTEYRKYAQLRVEALNFALRDLPIEQIQVHVCWGSFHGPHQNDIPLEDIADVIFSVRASRFSIEASNPMHEHEWRVFEDVTLPDGAILIPGVVGHATNFIEHPKLVAERLERYANLVGKENVMAGTDCGIGPRVGHAKIAWAKLAALSAGARLASEHLWAK